MIEQENHEDVGLHNGEDDQDNEGEESNVENEYDPQQFMECQMI